MRQKLVGAILGLGLIFGVSAGAWADMITLNITVGNASISGMGPFGQVVINRTDSTHATLTFTSTSPDLFTDGSSVAFNVNSTGFGVVLPVSGNCPSCTYTVAFNTQVNGFGNFNTAIDSGNSGPNGRSSTITVSIVDVLGTWASASAVLIANNAGNEVAAHICVRNSVNDTGCAVTGFATQTGGVEQEGPEPGILSLLGIGIFALGFTAMRRRA